MITLVKKRVIPFIVCFSILLSAFAYRPQKADAFVVTTTTTAVIAAVAAVMTACGVSFWANTQQDAIDYLGSKIDEYLSTLSFGGDSISYGEWLDVYSPASLFTIIGNGVLSFGTSVANKILDFVRWFNQEEDVSSGGQPVGELGGKALLYDLTSSGLYIVNNNLLKCLSSPPNVFQYTDISTNSSAGIRALRTGQHVTTQSPLLLFQTSYLGNSMQFIAAPNIQYYYFYSNSLPTVNSDVSIPSSYSVYSGNAININKNYAYLWIHPSWYSTATYNQISMSLSGTNKTPDKAIVTPSSNVTVPSAISVGQTFDVATNANISQGASVEDASSAILDTVVTTGGLSSTNDVAGEAVPSESIWLWDAITSLPATISQAIGGLFIPSADFADTFAATAYAMFDNHFSILSYPFSILGEFSTRLLTLGTPQPIFRWGNIKDPFSDKIVISAGQYNLNDALQNQKVAEIYDLYMLLVKAFISFQFINFLYAWFCDVFKMRESDYPLPFDDADSDSDVEDGDGYDGYYSS